MESYSTSQAAKATGVSGAVLHYWAKTSFLQPSVQRARGTGTRRLWSYEDLVAIRTARALRGAGIPLRALRKLVQFLRRQLQMESPLAQAFLVAGEGGEVYTLAGDTLISALSGQGLLYHIVDLRKTAGEVREAVVRLEEARPAEQAEGSARAAERARPAG